MAKTFSLRTNRKPLLDALISLYESEELWNRLSENGLRKTRMLYSVETARRKLEVLFGDEHMRGSEQAPPIAEQQSLALSAR